MKKILIIFLLLFSLFFIGAEIYQEPWIQNQFGDQHNLSDMDWITANYFNGTFSGKLSGSVNWTKLQNYPLACPGSSAITALNDSVTCSDLWFNVAGNETISGNMTFTNSGILNLSLIESLDWTNVTITESQISNLVHTVNETNIDVLDINASSMTLHRDLNMSGGNLTLMDKITFRLGEIIDNLVDGWITITGNLNVSGNATYNSYYGGVFYHNHTATEVAFVSDGVYYPLFFTNASHLNGFSFLGGFNQTSNLTTQVAGLYQVTYMASGSGENNHEYYTSIFVDGVNKYNCENHKKMTAGGDIVTQSGNCFIDLSVGDVVDLRTADVGDTGTGNYYSSNLNLVRIGD